jgi:hypothetical protein
MIARMLMALLLVALAGCSTTDTLRGRAVSAQLADVGSTALALAQPGVYEMNPLGAAVLPIKVGVVLWAETKPPDERIFTHRLLSAYGWGAAVSNICTAGVAASAGATALPCLVLGIAVGWWDWKTTEGTPKEQFERLCAYARRDKPTLECLYTEPSQ